MKKIILGLLLVSGIAQADTNLKITCQTGLHEFGEHQEAIDIDGLNLVINNFGTSKVSSNVLDTSTIECNSKGCGMTNECDNYFTIDFKNQDLDSIKEKLKTTEYVDFMALFTMAMLGEKPLTSWASCYATELKSRK